MEDRPRQTKKKKTKGVEVEDKEKAQNKETTPKKKTSKKKEPAEDEGEDEGDILEMCVIITHTPWTSKARLESKLNGVIWESRTGSVCTTCGRIILWR